MKTSELIEKLEKIKQEYGDLPIYHTHEWTELLEDAKFMEEYKSEFSANCFPDRIELS